MSETNVSYDKYFEIAKDRIEKAKESLFEMQENLS